MWTAEDRTVDRLLIEQLMELLDKKALLQGAGRGLGGSLSEHVQSRTFL
jgi:hypothetical protein